jgi:hypothetical protein
VQEHRSEEIDETHRARPEAPLVLQEERLSEFSKCSLEWLSRNHPAARNAS